MERQILTLGYLTYALTDGETIFRLIKHSLINFESDEFKNKTYYLSQVYCEPGAFAQIIRKGTLITNREELPKLFAQSIMNLSRPSDYLAIYSTKLLKDIHYGFNAESDEAAMRFLSTKIQSGIEIALYESVGACCCQ